MFVSCWCVKSYNCSFISPIVKWIFNTETCNCSHLKPVVMRLNNPRKVWHNNLAMFFTRMFTSVDEGAWRRGKGSLRPACSSVRWRMSQAWRTIRQRTQRWPVSEPCWIEPCSSLPFPEWDWNFLLAFLYSSGNVNRHNSPSCTSKYAQKNPKKKTKNQTHTLLRDTWTVVYIIFPLENSWIKSYVELQRAYK